KFLNCVFGSCCVFFFQAEDGIRAFHVTGVQTCALPISWAPTQIIALEGLRRYGYTVEADRISYNFVSMIAENFHRDGTIREKYNAVTRSSETAVKAGYNINVVGFGWTNAAVVVFLHEMPQELTEKLAREQAQLATK